MQIYKKKKINKKKKKKMESEPISLILNIIIIGDAGVGKTNLLSQYINKIFNEDTRPTIGADYSIKVHQLQKKKINVRFWDTAGQEKYRAISKKFYKDAHGVILVYDVTNKDSFDYLQNWKKEIEENCKENVVVMLIGNKLDLVEDKEVSEENGKGFAKDNGYFFLETSAKKDQGVNEAFELVIVKSAEQPMKELDLVEVQDVHFQKLPKIMIPEENKGCC